MHQMLWFCRGKMFSLLLVPFVLNIASTTRRTDITQPEVSKPQITSTMAKTCHILWLILVYILASLLTPPTTTLLEFLIGPIWHIATIPYRALDSLNNLPAPFIALVPIAAHLSLGMRYLRKCPEDMQCNVPFTTYSYTMTNRMALLATYLLLTILSSVQYLEGFGVERERTEVEEVVALVAATVVVERPRVKLENIDDPVLTLTNWLDMSDSHTRTSQSTASALVLDWASRSSQSALSRSRSTSRTMARQTTARVVTQTELPEHPDLLRVVRREIPEPPSRPEGGETPVSRLLHEETDIIRLHSLLAQSRNEQRHAMEERLGYHKEQN
jgi:hypothetical protein